MLHGFLLIDKPAGITSHDVIDKLRKVTGIKKIGHAGTLDPFATGLLIVAVGREATKQISNFVKLDKTYDAQLVLGATTETLDPETPEIRTPLSPPLKKEQIEEALKKLTGEITQIPPMHSAIKVKGKRLYELARQGKTIEVEPRKVRINNMSLISEPTQADGLTVFDVHIDCSSGTYIRAIARDLAGALSTLGYVKTLRRTSIGTSHIADAVPLAMLCVDNWTKFLRNVTLDL